jgi:16S rRNA (adenine1518-N6/adenine1519-N6)-dimethyltransferase
LSAGSNSRIQALPPLRDVIRDAGLQATKALGQNFLLDLNLTASIARLNGDLTGIDVVEVGPGPGGLTRALLLNNARSVHAVEFDARAIEALGPLVQASEGRLHLHHADALSTDLTRLAPNPAIIANLPYNVATPILINSLKSIADVKFMLLMFQKEVADRIVAKPGSKTYGRLSVMAQYTARVKSVKTIPPSAFTPPPKIHSSVVLFEPKAQDGFPKFGTMEKILAEAFNQRRKMLRAALKDSYAPYLKDAGIDETLRAEDVPVEAWMRLAKIIEAA